MFCSKCGTQNNVGEGVCKSCGTLLSNEQPQNVQTNNTMNQQNFQSNGVSQQNVQFQSSTGSLDQNYVNKAVNPNMSKWAVLSVIVPIVAIIWYVWVGLSFYIAIFIAATGFGFAQKGEMSNKKLAIVGKVLNGILCGLAIVMLILIKAFA